MLDANFLGFANGTRKGKGTKPAQKIAPALKEIHQHKAESESVDGRHRRPGRVVSVRRTRNSMVCSCRVSCFTQICNDFGHAIDIKPAADMLSAVSEYRAGSSNLSRSDHSVLRYAWLISPTALCATSPMARVARQTGTLARPKRRHRIHPRAAAGRRCGSRRLDGWRTGCPSRALPRAD